VFTKGFDVPDVLCGISARPYRKSFSSHIQQIGRVMRPSPGKEFALWLDHAGNVLRFWDDQSTLFASGVAELVSGNPDKKARKESDTDKAQDILCCARCSFVLPRGAQACPACGHESKRRNMVEVEAGVMVTVGGKQQPAVGKLEYLGDREAVWRMLTDMALERKGSDIEAAQKFAQAQYRNIYGEFARRRVDNTIPMPCSMALHTLVQSSIIRWAKSRAMA